MTVHRHMAVLGMMHRLMAMSMLVRMALSRVTKRAVVDGFVLLDVMHLVVVMMLLLVVMLLLVLSSMQLVAFGTLHRLGLLVTDTMSELGAKLVDRLLLLQEDLRVAQVQGMTVLRRMAVVHMLVMVVMVMSDWR